MKQDITWTNEVSFSSYLETSLTQDSKEKLKSFFTKYPNVKSELIEQAKNSMANTIFDEKQSREYINWVKDTLKYINRYL